MRGHADTAERITTGLYRNVAMLQCLDDDDPAPTPSSECAWTLRFHLAPHRTRFDIAHVSEAKQSSPSAGIERVRV